VDIAGGPKGDELKQQIEAGKYPGFVKTTLDGFDQRDYLEGKSEKSARDVFYYFSGATPSAVRFKNWKMYYTMSQAGAAGWLQPLVTYHFTLVQNIKRPVRANDHGDPRPEDGYGLWRRARRSFHRVLVRLRLSARRPEVVAGAPGNIQQIPAPAGAGELQP
jgi:hypothetical protein